MNLRNLWFCLSRRFKNRSLLASTPGCLVVSLLLIAGVAGCEGRSGEASTSGLDDPSTDVAVPVLLGEIQRGVVSDRLAVDADLEAVAKADYHGKIAGIVKSVLKREGDSVRRDEPVILLEDDALRLQVENKRILHAQARIKVQQADVARREGAKMARQKEILLEKARTVYERARQLSTGGTTGIVSNEELESKKFDLDDAEVAFQTSSLQKEKYELEHSQRIEEEKLQAVELKTAEYNLSQTVLASPIDGVISYLRLKPGEPVSTTQKAFSVVDLTRLEARLQVPQRELARIREGLRVVLQCEVFSGKRFDGVVEVIKPVVEAQGTVEVLVSVSDPSGFLRPGMFVNGDIVLETREHAVLVPKKAISYENQQPVVFFVRDGVAHRYAVTRGFSTRDAIEVLALTGFDGLEIDLTDPARRETENLGRLVLVGHDNLKEGSRVNARE